MELKKWVNENKIIVLVTFVGICIVGFILVMVFMVKENSECIVNPFTYSANRITTASSGGGVVVFHEPLCSCDLGNGEYFYFDKEGIYRENPNSHLLFNEEIPNS